MLHSWKFATNGVWEEALFVGATQSIDIVTVEQWVARNPQNIALEAVFAQSGIPATVFGIRITGLPKSEQIERVKSLLLKTNDIKIETDFRKVAAETFPEFGLFPGEPEALNIGIINQWFSVGEEMVWNRQAKAPLTLGELAKKAPRFLEPRRNPAAIEFWYTGPTDHWYKIYVSDLSARGYLINPAKYRFAVDRLKSFVLE